MPLLVSRLAAVISDLDSVYKDWTTVLRLVARLISPSLSRTVNEDPRESVKAKSFPKPKQSLGRSQPKDRASTLTEPN